MKIIRLIDIKTAHDLEPVRAAAAHWTHDREVADLVEMHTG